MKSSVFARPNLKLFLLAAIMLICIQQFIIEGHSQGRTGLTPPVAARGTAHEELRQLMEDALMRPSARAYMRLCTYFERRSEYRKALYYLKKAEEIAQNEDYCD